MRTAPRDAMISLSVPPTQLATAFGVHRALDAAGAAIGPVLAFVLLWRLPRRYDVIFFTSFIVAVLGVAALALLVDERPDRRSADSSATRLLWPDTLAVFSDPSIRPVMILAAAFGLVTISDAFIYLLLVQKAHAGPEWIPLLYTGTALSFLALAVPVGFLADRIGRRTVFVGGHVLLIAAYVSAFAGFSAWPWNAVICVALLGAYYAASDGVLAGLASGLLSTTARALGLAWVATAVSVARLCSAVTFGFLWTRAGDRTAVLSFTVALVVVLAFALIVRDIERPVAP
jgi:MFS family permease